MKKHKPVVPKCGAIFFFCARTVRLAKTISLENTVSVPAVENLHALSAPS